MAIIPFPQTETQGCKAVFIKAGDDYNKADYSAMLAVLGNGNANAGFRIFYAITMRLIHARSRHPVFTQDRTEALEVIKSEFDKLVYAVENEEKCRQLDEALDVLVTALRFYGKEWK